MLRPLRDSVYLYGLHDPGGERVMLDLDVPGWIVFTEDRDLIPITQGKNYSRFSDNGMGVLVRLNPATPARVRCPLSSFTTTSPGAAPTLSARHPASASGSW